MKKILILCLAAMLLLAGCNKQTSDPEPDSNPVTTPAATTPAETPAETPGGTENDPNAPVTPDPSVPSFGYTQGTISSMTVTDIAKGITVDVSANGVLKAGLMRITYDPAAKKADAGEAIYELKINGKSLYVYAENVAAYDGSDAYPCQSFDLLAYLGGLLVGDVIALNHYDTNATLKVQNGTGGTAEISDKPAFFVELGKVNVIKLGYAADYTLPSVAYTVTVGEESMKICGNYLQIGADVYAVTAGNFAFLSTYTFSSSSGGFLPWI